VDTTQLADDAVTNAKVAANAVDTTQLADDAVTQAKIADDAVGADQLASDAVNAEIMLMAGGADFANNAPVRDIFEASSPNIAVPVLKFTDGANRSAWWSIIMPSDWDGGNITAQFYWLAEAGSGGVTWDISAVGFGDDDGIDGQTYTAQASVTDTLTATSDLCITSETSSFTPRGSSGGGEFVLFLVRRDVADGGDTLAEDAQLVGVRLSYGRS